MLLYLIRLADKLDIDMIDAAKDKLAINAEKYPADKARVQARSTRTCRPRRVIVYQSTKSGFLNDAFKKDIEAVVLAIFKAQTGRGVSQAEVRSWKASLWEIAKVLNEDEIPCQLWRGY